MKTETAKEILKKQYEKTYATLYKQSILGSTYEKLVIEAMIEFAKIKCKQQRELCFNEISTEDKKDIDLYETVETVKRFVLNAPTPDFE